MESSEKHLKDIAVIKQMMERSSRFISLSGWSGIGAGFFALLGTAVAWRYMAEDEDLSTEIFLIVDWAIVLILALVSSFFFSWRKARKQGEKFWSPVTARLVWIMMIPLFTGGALSIIFIYQDLFQLVAGITLIFYGLALVNAGRFSHRETVVLGITEIIVGIAAILWHRYGLYFWGIGFGLFHIIYGIALYYKYDRQR
ncbi:MAG: hypothetical protein KAR19_08985 [Bacteroidales bacterium]|nr:hypothetical protein [Bacteroidales bacterium]